MSLRDAIVSQFVRPRGLLGRIAGWILATRGSNLRRNRWTVDLLAPADGERVLEVGCGPGVALELCLARAGVRVVGVDHSALMIKQAAKRNARAVKDGRLVLIEGTIDVTPAEAPFDRMFSINVIQFVDRPAFVARAKALLKPGGMMATTCQPRHAKATRADALKLAAELTDLMTAAAFTGVRVEELDLKPVPAVCVIGRRGMVSPTV
jgi:cyclopropane fatty-acyl-phospholipid synthase-like methyltransferase